MNDTEWEKRLAEQWASIDELPEEEFLAGMDRLVAELPAGSAIGRFERAGALDATDHPDLAVPLYREALDLGLHGKRRREAVIQLASSLRNIGRAAESVELLTAELAVGSEELEDAVIAFLALALADLGREREGLSLALTALAPHLTQYQRSLGNYAQALLSDDSG
ncbi:tetratricopeptide repeat protein [Lacisediminihabitans profunda]|uniref:Tetratricopeptide repeat protein n=1 Tax=Lacisediminihabitans profunda TaxID=2594790 RepID=A0A5C8UQ68_9MICO|nr:tetratricopeptide repeat protein [Lacisediminihabitans profunda]TXN29710.1 tetratricopeptide repeat protein [Lacisediminihabitans profunda]